MKNLIKFIAVGFFAISGFSQASSEFQNDQVYIDIHRNDTKQNGAKLYINYCLACHSLKYQRYGRMAVDIEIPEEIVMENMLFTGTKIGDLMTNNMPAEEAEKWFGTKPPDLSLIVRAKGADWLYTYLRGFYQDESRPFGVNNIAFKDVGMPHALESLQGLQVKTTEALFQEDIIANATSVINTAEPQLNDEKADKAALNASIETAEHEIHEANIEILSLRKNHKYFEVAKQGALSPEEYDKAVRDIVAFLDYVAEPIKKKRQSMGLWVMLFLFILFIPAYYMKKEYWKDVH
jgi:ubiquinol-cytochrome c reductase cytochrome c1 subunit